MALWSLGMYLSWAWVLRAHRNPRWGSGSYALTNVVPPVTSLTSKLQSISPSITLSTSLTNDIDAAVAAARGKDVAFVFANAMSGELGFYDVFEGNMGDRNDLNLWWKGGSLVSV